MKIRRPSSIRGRMRTVILLAALLGLGALALLASCARAQPAPLVDLYVTEQDVVLLVGGFPSAHAIPGELLIVNVTIHDAIGGNFSGANVSFYDGDTYLGTMPARGVPGGPGDADSCFSQLILDTGNMAGGIHTMRVEVISEGDINTANNSAGTNLTIHDRPSVDVRFLQTVREVAVDNAAHVTVTFSGSAVVFNTEPGYLMVDLESSCELGWASICGPDALEYYFGGDGPEWQTRDFTLYVIVPSGARADMPCNLTVKARVLGKGGTYEASGNVSVRVKPYDEPVISSDQSYQVIAQKQTATVTVRVQNAGNSVRSFEFGIANRAYLSIDWRIDIGNYSLAAMAPGECRNVTFNASVPDKFSIFVSYPAMFVVKVTSIGSNASSTPAEAMFYIYIYRHGPDYLVCTILALVLIVLGIGMIYFFAKGVSETGRKLLTGNEKAAGAPPTKKEETALSKGLPPVREPDGAVRSDPFKTKR